VTARQALNAELNTDPSLWRPCRSGHRRNAHIGTTSADPFARDVSGWFRDCPTQRQFYTTFVRFTRYVQRISKNSSWHRTCSFATSVRHRRSHAAARGIAGALRGILVVAASVVATACASSPVLTTSPSPSKCQVALSTPTVSVDVGGTAGTVSVNTERECAWEAAAAADWITLTSAAGGRGAGLIEYRVLANPDSVARQGAITVNDQRLEINQAAAPCRVSVEKAILKVGADGGAEAVAVAAPRGCSWTVASAANWIALPVTTFNGSAQLAVSVQPNGGPPRSATLSIADQTITIDQATVGSACQYNVSPATPTIPATGGGASITVTAAPGCAWSISNSTGWLSVASGSAGVGNGIVNLTAGANTGAARSGTVTVAGQSVTVNQAEFSVAPPAPVPPVPPPSTTCSYAISPGGASIGAAGGSTTVAIIAPSGCSWATTSQVAWLTVTSGTSGSGSATVTLAVSANGGPARSGTVSLGGQTFTVQQAAVAAQACSYAVNPATASVGAGASTAPAVNVTAAAGCAWTATSNAGWITVTSGSTGSGDGSVSMNVTANAGPARSGTVTIAGRTFTLTQAANCSYAINPVSASVAAGGGAGPSVTVTTAAGCTWTSTSNAAWISVTSGATGSGNGSVAFTAGANAGAARAGTLTIAGQTLTVNQAGCSYSINPSSASIKAGGGNGPTVHVTTTAGCSWTAVSNDSWITLTSGASDTGNGSVGFKVSKNVGAARTGTLTIAGNTFTVSQE
jgi:Putative binding domain, N-terminal